MNLSYYKKIAKFIVKHTHAEHRSIIEPNKLKRLDDKFIEVIYVKI